VSAGARLAVPGPVWGERPRRPELLETPGGAMPAPRRGAPGGPWARLRARRRGADAGSIAAAAQVLARRLEGAGARAGLGRAQARLAAHGLTAPALVAALGVAGALMARATGLVPRTNQYACAALLLGERLVEMDTGEGKSVAVALAAGVAALGGAPVHVLTANPYLAARDAQAFERYYARLGLSVAAVDELADEPARRAAWSADVAYAAARTLGFDDLRDGLADAAGGPPLLRGLCVAIVDEADSILLDEARTPLVIAEAHDDPQHRARAWQALEVARRLHPGRDFEPDAAGGLRLTDAGRAAMAAQAEPASADAARDPSAHGLVARRLADLVPQALAALHLLRRDVDYLVADRAIVLIDAATGRASPQRRLSRELHALVALKEGLPPPPGTRVRASVTYPRLFARYHHLCGTSGTLAEGRREFRRDYGLRVERVERTHPCRRTHGPMRLYQDRDGQFGAALERAGALADAGRCVLVATDSVEESAALAAGFAAAGREVAVLDARHDRDEHARVAQAGAAGRITISTQMAGRGTDIRLEPAAAAAGGLHVLSLQHNRSRRIDRQVAGRAARQADPGSTEHWPRLSGGALEDPRLPRPLRWVLRAARPFARRGPGDAGPPGERFAAACLWWLCRLWWRQDDVTARATALGHDRRWSRRLHFATMGASKTRLE